MRSSDEEINCYACHDGSVAANSIRAQFAKSYTHPVAATAGLHDPGESPSQLTGHVECADCHNAHAAYNSPAIPPAVTGRLAAVPGVQSDGITPVAAARYEYEICFKCHAGSAPQLFLSGYAPIQRVVNTFNTSVEFNTANPSYMPVIDTGKNPDVPSLKLPGADADTPPYLGITAKIYCSDCHSDDGATRGPHGSQYAPLLRKRYETAVGTQESDQNYGLCYRCHDRFSILSDATFRRTIGGGHSGHLQAAAGRAIPCSVCHDPHGVKDLPGTGSHSHLINFDVSMVKPAGGNPYPLFTDTGSRSGACTLICHFPDSTTKEHLNAVYP
jgi:hypothetical protein